METFAERLQLFEEFEIHIQRAREYRGSPPDRQAVDLDLLEGVVLPLTPDEWGTLCQRDGEAYIGGCCSALSSVQDQMQGIYRDNGYVTCQHLDEIVQTLRQHDGDDFPLAPDISLDHVVNTARTEWVDYSPWLKIIFTWRLTEGCFTMAQPDSFGPHTAPLDRAMGVLAHSLRYLKLSRFFHGADGDMTTSTSEIQGQASNMLATARLLPALKTLNQHIDELKLPPIEGFVLVNSNNPSEVLHNGFGHCFYLNEADIHELVESWRKSKEEHQDEVTKPKFETLGWRRARISVEKGVEFLDDGPVILPV
jgi:hypothetical protein